MLSLLVALSALPQEKISLTLAADTVIDRALPDGNAGREPILKVGDGRVLLIKFPELGTRVGSGKRVKSATLTFTLASSTTPQIVGASRLLKPWGEGGTFSHPYDAEPAKAVQGDATWNSAMNGLTRWGLSGARDEADAEPLSEVAATSESGAIVLRGLARAVQSFVDSPWNNFGLRLEFKGESAVMSADAFSNGPVLEVVFEDEPVKSGVNIVATMVSPDNAFDPIAQAGQTVHYSFYFSNLGTTASSSLTYFVSINGEKPTEHKTTGLAPKESGVASITATLPAKKSHPSHSRITVWIKSPEKDDDPSSNGLVYYPLGLNFTNQGGDLDHGRRLAAQMNEWILPLSKFGSAPYGCQERLNFVATDRYQIAAHLESAYDARALLTALTGLGPRLRAPYGGEPPVLAGVPAPAYLADSGQLGLLPDTRDDVLVPRVLPIPEGKFNSALDGGIPLQPRNLLSRTETNLLNALQGKVGAARRISWDNLPKNVMFKVTTRNSLVPSGMKLEMFQLVGGAFGSTPLFSTPVEQDGLAFMPLKSGMFAEDGSNSWLLAVVTAGGGRSATWIPVWRFWDEFARGNKTTAMLEVPYDPTEGPKAKAENFALGRLVSDSRGRFPAQLSAVVDENESTALDLTSETGDYWIEVDLGRERAIAEIEVVFDGEPWKRFQIVAYKSGQSVEAARIWAAENKGGGTSLKYQVRADRARYVRFVVEGQSVAKIKEIRLLGG